MRGESRADPADRLVARRVASGEMTLKEASRYRRQLGDASKPLKDDVLSELGAAGPRMKVVVIQGDDNDYPGRVLEDRSGTKYWEPKTGPNAGRRIKVDRGDSVIRVMRDASGVRGPRKDEIKTKREEPALTVEIGRPVSDGPGTRLGDQRIAGIEVGVPYQERGRKASSKAKSGGGMSPGIPKWMNSPSVVEDVFYGLIAKGQEADSHNVKGFVPYSLIPKEIRDYAPDVTLLGFDPSKLDRRERQLLAVFLNHSKMAKDKRNAAVDKG